MNKSVNSPEVKDWYIIDTEINDKKLKSISPSSGIQELFLGLSCMYYA